ncbi:MAG: LysR family transcriptional regulator [Alphaproteobacteria bacterium]|nr:LysR family transcriptional regulator [Alphaproteobacteria bacterium]
MINKRYMQDLNAMMLLLAVDKYQSKRKVAEYTNTSIDTVNKYLRNLEHNLGSQLLINNTTGCHLTKRGRQIVEKLYDVADILEQIYTQRVENNKFKGNVSIAIPSFAYALFHTGSELDFWEKYPEIKITVLTNLSSANNSDIAADLLLSFSFEGKWSQNYSLLSKKEMKMNMFASPKYVKKYGLPQNTSDLLKNHHLIDYEESSCLPPEWKNLANQAKHCVFVSNSMYAVRKAVENGWGIGFLPNDEDTGLISLDNFNFDSKITFYLLVNEKAKNMPRVKAAATYYKNYLEMLA